ncbi:DNA helicase IV [Haloactinopolyspora alba]|uniref:DNA helicase IV n=1 Tax=Haloactinopolyspora alba TaxID=648780 RepID=A0A2P8DIC7_9ACTN|nr:AAA family ATPase [Haloactinopolyspora alba]PSK96976.1 DNA helicase IV [Haloactinopolyspora alba]
MDTDVTLSNRPAGAQDDAVRAEQPYISRLYERLDLLRERTAARLAELYKQRGGTHQAVWDREAFVARDVERLERLGTVDRGLCFGRLDFDGRATSYIGRIGLSDDDYETMLVDWRAPAAEPFYRATAAAPGDLVRRRHIQTRRREVLAVDDEVFDQDALPAGSAGTLRGEAALLASLTANRTGRMSDIVATIQAEQDRIIRSPLAGVLVVQGGPGTGKTVAALHRAAYLLYTHRDRLSEKGVLVVGPNRTFLHYIDQVLPSLGETGVVLSTVGQLVPGVEPTGAEPDETAVVKGDPRMAEVIATAVRDRQRVPREEQVLRVDRTELVLDAATCRSARTKARRSRRPHNAARRVFVRTLLDELAEQHARRLGEVIDEEDLAELRGELQSEPDVAAVMDELWPSLTPQQLVADLFADPKRLAAAARRLDPAERELLARDDAAWTPADVPLLDEAAEALGPVDDPDAAARAEREREEAEVRYAQELLDQLDLDVPVDPALVAERYRGSPTHRSVVDRASADREWSYGHVIVDEAQELSPMAWRMVMRRAPGRSMTVVGDIAQTGAAAGARSWGQVLEPFVPGRWRQETLTVNYRTPTEVMDAAAGALRAIDPDLVPPESVRSTGRSPAAVRVEPDGLTGAVVELATEEADAVASGRVAVIVPAARLNELHAAIAADVPATVSRVENPEALDATVTVLTVGQVKGLEFDSVLVVEPAEMLRESSHGATDLYVALTRPTQRLGLAHTGDLPDMLQGAAVERR